MIFFLIHQSLYFNKQKLTMKSSRIWPYKPYDMVHSYLSMKISNVDEYLCITVQIIKLTSYIK